MNIKIDNYKDVVILLYIGFLPYIFLRHMLTP